MPYKKRYNNNRRRGAGRKRRGAVSNVSRFIRKGAKTALYAYSAYKLATRLADKINPEYKSISGSNAVNPTYSGTVVDLTTLITQGVTNGLRVGDSLKLQRITIRFYIELIDTPASNEQQRIILFRDQQNTIATGANMLLTAGSVFAPISPKNQDNKYDSNIIFDRLVSLANYAGGAVSRHFDVNIPLNFHTHYAAASATVKDNALKLLFISDTAVASTSVVRYYYFLTYTDD